MLKLQTLVVAVGGVCNIGRHCGNVSKDPGIAGLTSDIEEVK